MLWELRHIKTLFLKISFYSRTKWFLMWELGHEFCPYFVPELGQNMFMRYVFHFSFLNISIFKYMLHLFLFYHVICSHSLNIVSCRCHLHSKISSISTRSKTGWSYASDFINSNNYHIILQINITVFYRSKLTGFASTGWFLSLRSSLLVILLSGLSFVVVHVMI
jgi:hypothetical protein